mgnify:CR=1 FL=1
MYPTAEMRWFLPGAIPEQVQAWFRSGPGHIEREPYRTDRYLLPESAGMNVKLRQGRIEVKRRFGEAGQMRISERTTGVLEHWHKWSFELAEAGSLAAEGSRSLGASWISVRKERQLRRYRVRGGEDPVALLPPASAGAGCELEITKVEAAGQLWWTLAFEAFGDESSLQANLLLVARHVLMADDSPRLRAGDSRSYASWLTGLLQRKGSR